jgi:hypothetical protein
MPACIMPQAEHFTQELLTSHKSSRSRCWWPLSVVTGPDSSSILSRHHLFALRGPTLSLKWQVCFPLPAHEPGTLRDP